MQIEEIIIQKLLAKDKTKRVLLFQPINKEDNRKKLLVSRPTENSILPSEVYNDTKNPADEKQVIEAIKNLEEQKRVKSVQAQRQGEEYYWIELV